LLVVAEAARLAVVADDTQRDKTPGKPQDALEAILRTVATPVGAAAPDPDVALAFATGWHAGEAIVAAEDGAGTPITSAAAEEAGTRITQACAQIRADVAHLEKRLQAAKQDASALAEAIETLEKANADAAGKAADELSARLGAQLLAAHFTLGKAFGLGCAIAQLFARTTFVAADFGKSLLDKHDTLHDWLSQLATALPPNAAHSVRDSLNMWGDALARNEKNLDALQRDHVVTQGERWRSLLSGEKAGKDTLELIDYVGVGEGMVTEIQKLAVGALRGMWAYLLVVLALVALGVVGIVVWQHTAGSAAGIASILTALGLTWKGLGGSLGRAVARIEQPAWDAQVDRAIAYAITRPLPGELIAGAPHGTLLAGLGAWRKSHARPSDQGLRRLRPDAPAEPAEPPA
jgi:hypothetical protein